MVDAQFDLEFLQALFLRTEVIHVGITHIVRLAEKYVLRLSFDDLLRQLVELGVCVAH